MLLLQGEEGWGDEFPRKETIASEKYLRSLTFRLNQNYFSKARLSKTEPIIELQYLKEACRWFKFISIDSVFSKAVPFFLASCAQLFASMRSHFLSEQQFG